MAREIQDTPAGGYAPRREAARVPKYEGFQVQARQMGYNPTSLNIARAPDVGFNAALDRASVRFDRMAEKVQAEQDDARVTEAITDLRRHATDLEAGENGWRKLLQGNALEPDAEGKGLVERVDTDMRQYGEAIGEKLTGRQRAQFNRHAMNVYQSVYGGVSSHVATQGMEYQKTTYTSAIDFEIEAAATNGYKIDALNDSEARIIENVNKLVDLSGQPPDQYENLRRKYVSGMYSNAILGVMSKADTNPAVAVYADGLLKNNSKKMLGSDVMRLRKSIEVAKAELDWRNQIERGRQKDAGYDTMVDGARVKKIQQEHGMSSGVNSDPSTAEFYTIAVVDGQGRLQTDNSEIVRDEKGYHPSSRFGASGVSIENAYGVDKNIDADRLVKDKNYNLEAGLTVLGRYVTDYAGDKQMALAAYFSSPKTVEQAIKAAEASEGKTTWVENLPQKAQEKLAKSMKHWSDYENLGVSSTSGRRASAFDVGSYAEEKYWETPEEARKDILETSPRARADPSHLEKCLNARMADQARRKASYKQEQERLMAHVSDLLYANRGDIAAIPNEVRSQLTRAQWADVVKAGNKLIRGEDTTNQTVKKIYDDDNRLLAVSMDGLAALRPNFSQKDFDGLVARWVNLRGGVRSAQEEAELSRRFGSAGVVLSKYVPKKAPIESALSEDSGMLKVRKKSPALYNHLTGVYQNAIALIREKDPTALQDELAVKDWVRRQSSMFNSLDPDKAEAVLLGKTGAFPDDGVTDANNLAAKLATHLYGHKNVSKEEISKAAQVILFTPELTNGFNWTPSENVRKKIEQECKRRGRPYPGKAEELRLYFLMRLSGEDIPVLEGFSDIENTGL